MLVLKNPLLLFRRTRDPLATCIRIRGRPLLQSWAWVVIDLLMGMFNVMLADYSPQDPALASGEFNDFDAHCRLWNERTSEQVWPKERVSIQSNMCVWWQALK